MSVISFPNLFGGLEIAINRVAFSIFGVQIYWYGILIGIAFALAVILVLRDAKKTNINEDDLINMLLIAIPIAIICARLFYVVFFIDDGWSFVDIFNIRDGGLAIYGGIIGGFAVALIYTRVKKMNFLVIGDLVVPYIALGQAIGRWGNFFNQEAFGSNTLLPWGMTSVKISNTLSSLGSFNGVQLFPNIPVHPTFLYESIWNILVFTLLIVLRKKQKYVGQIFCAYLALYGFGRMFIEGLRLDSLLIGGIRANQIIGFLCFVLFTVILIVMRISKGKTKKAKIDKEYDNTGESEFSSILKTKETVDEEDVTSEEDIKLELKNDK